MSLVGDRQAIATALSTVEGVKGYPKRPKTTKVGDGWPLLGALERGPGMSFAATWRVLVQLPSDELAASDWIDTRHEDLADALEPVGYVDRIEPVAIATEAGDKLGVQITIRSE